MRKMKYIYLIAAVWCGTTLTGHAQQAAQDSVFQFTLQDCVNYAYLHQDTVKNAALDVKSAEYKVKEVTGQGLPQISGTSQFTDYLKTPVTVFDLSSFGIPGFSGLKRASFVLNYQHTMNLNVNQIIFDGGFLLGVKASKTYKELSERSLIRSKIETNVNVTKAYYQVLVSNEQIKLLDANIAQLKQQLDQTVAENKQGLVEAIDVNRITVQYNNLVTNRENTIRLLSLNGQMLKFQMGMPIQDSIVLKDKLEDVNLSNNAAVLSVDTGFYNNRIEYSLSQTSLKLNELNLKHTKASYLPTLSAIGNTGLTFQNNSFSQLYAYNYPSTYVGLSLNVPIFSGGQRLNQVRESRITVEKSQNDLENLKNAINLQANSARINYINGLKTLNNQRQNQALAAEVLRVAKIKYQQGVGSSIEVTQAETDLVNADNQYIQGLYDALISKVDLDQAYGRIK